MAVLLHVQIKFEVANFCEFWALFCGDNKPVERPEPSICREEAYLPMRYSISA